MSVSGAAADTQKRPPARSGFCNPSWKVETAHGKASHERCRKEDCPCTCGLGPMHAQKAPQTPKMSPPPARRDETLRQMQLLAYLAIAARIQTPPDERLATLLTAR